MLNNKQSIKTKLDTILTTQYELFADTNAAVPCITFIESGDSHTYNGDTINYETQNYTIKIWAKSVQTISEKAPLVDDAMRELGYKLIGGNETVANRLICKILNYQAVGQTGSAAWY